MPAGQVTPAVPATGALWAEFVEAEGAAAVLGLEPFEDAGLVEFEFDAVVLLPFWVDGTGVAGELCAIVPFTGTQATAPGALGIAAG